MDGINERIEQEKHEIAVLTELVLYNKIRAFDTDSNVIQEEKEKLKDEAIDAFVAECQERYKDLSLEQIKEHVIFVLDRTIEGMKKIMEEYER